MKTSNAAAGMGATVAPKGNLVAPSELGIMVGFPPPKDKQVTRDSILTPAHLRWRNLNQSKMVRTARVSRGEGPIIPLPRGPELDVDGLTVQHPQLGPVAMQDMYESSGVDALLVLHRGKIVFERYFGDMTAVTQHVLFSATKSFVGLLVEWLVSEGKIDRDAPAGTYVPELAGTAIGAATVQQLQDMEANYDFPAFPPRVPGQIQRGYLAALGFLDPGANYSGPVGVYDVLVSNRPTVPHGGAFRYDNGSTDTLGWILRRVSGQSVENLISTRLWSRLGVEQDASMGLDISGTEWAAGGLALCLRDFARFGELVRNDGLYNGTRIVPAEVIREIRKGGNKQAFAKASLVMAGGSYHNQWWFYHDEFESFGCRGHYGQRIWIAPGAETVIAQFSTDPAASHEKEPFRLAAWQSIVRALRP